MPFGVKIDTAAFERDIRAACSAEVARVDAALLDAVKEATDGLKEELRDKTFTALGLKIAYAWQSRDYPNKDDPRGPAGFVWTKAPKIIDFWRAERIHTPLGAAFAIPVNPVVKRFGRAMSIAEVEAKFNQDLQPVRLKSGNIGLFADLVRAKSARRPGFRSPTKGRAAQGRKPQKVLMFVLVRSIRSRKLIDLGGPAKRWAARVPALFEARMGAGR